jgi:glucosamine--fructose-6-phosphate aminotransferase (isomerizing)
MSNMLFEALESPEVVAAILADKASAAELSGALNSSPPRVVLTVARGSSDHAASYFAYLVMRTMGVPVTSLPLSLTTHHGTVMRASGQLAVAFSQSGRSPDLLASMQMLSNAGSATVAVVNAQASPLEGLCGRVLPVLAGPETSVAATKSYVGMLARSAQLVEMWARRCEIPSTLSGELARLPDTLRSAARADWSPALEKLIETQRMFVIGRGAGLAVAMEAALKLKETSGIHAEAFSSAEVRHGPMEIVDRGFPLLVLAPDGPEQADVVQLALDMRARGATVILAAPESVAERDVPLVSTGSIMLNPIAAVLSFYVMAAQLAVERGRNPDTPRFLKKVTETV